jgi:hypothetical protein
MAIAVADGLGLAAVGGVSTRTVGAPGGGYRLTVRYPDVSRPALATPFDITIRHPGGFDSPIRVAVSRSWLGMWDTNAWRPSPASSTGDRANVVMEFDPPDGAVLRVSYDARIQPAQQHGSDGWVSLLDGSGSAVATVRFHTRIVP